MKLELYSYDKKDIIDDKNAFHLYLNEIEYDTFEFIATFDNNLQKESFKYCINHSDYLVFRRLDNSYEFINDNQFEDYYYNNEYSNNLFIFDLNEEINQYILEVIK